MGNRVRDESDEAGADGRDRRPEPPGAFDPRFADLLPQMIWVTDADHEPRYGNRHVARYHGTDRVSRAERILACHPDDRERMCAAARAAHDARKAYDVDARIRRPDGAYRWHRIAECPVRLPGGGIGWLGTALDIDDIVTDRLAPERRGGLLRLAHLARHDGLTGLPNRSAFHDRLEDGLAELRHGRGAMTVLCLDLDRLKAVNDTLGHLAGDELLTIVAGRLTGIVGAGDFVSRLGGDEFGIILSGPLDDGEALAVARRAIEAIARPIRLNGHPAHIGVSIGMAQAPADGTEADRLLKRADLALGRAKASGRNTVRLYEAGMDAAIEDRIQLEYELRDAVLGHHLTLHYQPVVDLAGDFVSGFEALMRWSHPTRGAIPPSTFIRIAEETGLIVDLGSWALREACREAAAWPVPARVAVNVSATQFREPSLEHGVVMALSASGLAPDRLELEITESVLIQDTEAVIACLHRLRGLGVRIALDDFGTGYSSLSYLRQFPFDKIKIDRSFIRDIADPDTAAIVRAIVGLGERRGMAITAEGVETLAQLDLVRAEGCGEVQGFYFGRPVPAREVPAAFARLSRVAEAA